MVKKYMPGVMAALIVLLSLLGSGGQAFAATGGTSLSKWVYAEAGENTKLASTITAAYSDAQIFAYYDTVLDANVTSSSTYDYWHIFDREKHYAGDGTVLTSQDNHYFVRVAKSQNASFLRQDGRVYFQNQNTFALVTYQWLSFTSASPITATWQSLVPTTQGIVAQNSANEGHIMVFEKLSPGEYYDPANPPPYGTPGYTEPNSGYPDPVPGNTDPDFPVQPTPPDSNWDLIGWIKYIVDWIIYLVKCFVYFLKSFGTAIADVVNGSASLISAMTDFFAFLPNQITTIIGMGLVAMIIVGIVKR